MKMNVHFGDSRRITVTLNDIGPLFSRKRDIDQHMSDDVRRELLRAASDHKTVTYGSLMKKFRLSRGAPGGKGVVGAIGEVDRREAQRGAPGFGAMVVRKDTGYPGGGFFCWKGVPSALRRPRREGSNPRLSDAEKRYVRKLQEEIWDYYKREIRDQSA
jgi:hypothetical protein